MFDDMDVAVRDGVSLQLLAPDSTVGMQLRQFAGHPDKELHRYPDAFVAVQEVAFASVVERRIEGEHAQVKFVAWRGFRFLRRAMVSARRRRHQHTAMVRDPVGLAWLCEQWRRKDIFARVLAHKYNARQVAAMSMAERYSHVYGYSASAHFQDVAELTAQSKIYQANQAALLPPLPELSADARQIVGLIKAHCTAGTVISMPAALFKLCETHLRPPEADFRLQQDTLVSAFVGELPPLTAEGCKDHVFLSVVDPRPEDKFRMGAPQVRSRLRLDVLPWSAWSPGDVLQVVTRTVRAESKTLDAAAFCFQ